MHLVHAFIQSDLVHSGFTCFVVFLSVCLFNEIVAMKNVLQTKQYANEQWFTESIFYRCTIKKKNKKKIFQIKSQLQQNVI